MTMMMMMLGSGSSKSKNEKLQVIVQRPKLPSPGTSIGEEEDEVDCIGCPKNPSCKSFFVLLLILICFGLILNSVSQITFEIIMSHKYNPLQLDFIELKENLLSLEHHIHHQNNNNTTIPLNIQQDLEQLHRDLLTLEIQIQKFTPAQNNNNEDRELQVEDTSSTIPVSVNKGVADERFSTYPDRILMQGSEDAGSSGFT